MIYKEIDGDTFLNENEIRLFQYIDDMKPRVALDVEMYAFSACRSLSGLPVFDRLKDYIFNRADIDGENGKISLSIAIVCEVLAIPLRVDTCITRNQSTTISKGRSIIAPPLTFDLHC